MALQFCFFHGARGWDEYWKIFARARGRLSLRPWAVYLEHIIGVVVWRESGKRDSRGERERRNFSYLFAEWGSCMLPNSSIAVLEVGIGFVDGFFGFIGLDIDGSIKLKSIYLLFLGLHESNTIQYFCNYCLALVNSWKFLHCLGLASQYEKYYCIALKFLIILSYVDVWQ